MNIEKEIAKSMKEAKAEKLKQIQQAFTQAAIAGITEFFFDTTEEQSQIQQLAGKYAVESGETEQRPFAINKPKYFVKFDWNA